MHKFNTLTLAISLLLVGTAHAQKDSNEPAEKGFVMPGAAASQPTLIASPAVAFKARVKPGRSAFSVGEPVQFEAKANRDFYLYIISVAPDGETLFLYPRAGDQQRRLKTGKSYTVPGNYDIVVDQPGVERVMVVSSLTPMNLADGARGIVTPGGSPSAAGRQVVELEVEIVAANRFPFIVTTTPESAVVRVMNIGPKYQSGMKLASGSYKLEVAAEGFETAELTVQHDEAHQTHEVELVSLTPSAPVSSSPEIILSAEQKVYTNGEVVSVQYGASQSGWVHLYTYINGEAANVASKQVESGKFYTMKATATEPHGEQTLVALWLEEEAVSQTTLSNLKAHLSASVTAKAADQKTVTAMAQRALVISVETPLNYKTLPLLINP